MRLFDSIAGGPRGIQNGSRKQRMSYQQMLSELKHNPNGIVNQSNFSVPNGMTDPEEIVKYLMDSGQVGGGFFNLIRNAISGRR